MNTTIVHSHPKWDRQLRSSLYADPLLGKKLDFLACLSGLTYAEKALIARWRANHTIPHREQVIFQVIWNRHASAWDKSPRLKRKRIGGEG